jgi:hypothetical protein
MRIRDAAERQFAAHGDLVPLILHRGRVEADARKLLRVEEIGREDVPLEPVEPSQRYVLDGDLSRQPGVAIYASGNLQQVTWVTAVQQHSGDDR